MELVYNEEKLKKYEERAKKLVGEMTLEEKVLQMLHHAPALDRLGIRAYNWWNESLHGVARAGTATCFPQAIGLAATFDEDLVEEIGEAVSTEGRAKYNMQQKFGDTDIYKGLTFWSPNVNIFRDPRWGRGQETFGEDPYLSSRLGVRFIWGLQGHDESYLKAAACAKHFAVHSGPEAVRHSFNAVVSKKDLYETYLPAFKACVKEAKVEAIMGAYNRTNGEPCCGSATLLQNILREEWGFKGHVVTDCWAVKDFYRGHLVTNNAIDSVALAVNAGSDLNCGNLFELAAVAVNEGKIKEERIDEALIRLFTARMKLGMFDGEKTPFDNIPYTAVDSPKMREFNLKVAENCMVLLQNRDNILPLNTKKISTIGVIGPNADSRKALLGNYEGTPSEHITILDGIKKYIENNSEDDVRVLYSQGCHLYKDRISGLSQGNDRMSEVKGVCDASDVIVAVLGLDADLEGEEGDTGNEFASGDKENLSLPGLQEEVLKAACESGKPVILVLLSGSAIAVPYAEEHAAAIIQGWYPGARGGEALANILFGRKNPEGKLPVTFYRSSEELPEFTDYSMKGRTYRYMKQPAWYPFGYGLSYTKFELKDVTADTTEITNKGVEIRASLVNTGGMDGAETLQIYVKAPGEEAPNPQLKALKKVKLKAGEKEEITIKLTADAFGLYNDKGKFTIEKGEYKVYAGTHGPDKRSKELTGTEAVCIEMSVKERIIL